MTLHRSTDYPLIRALITHPTQWRAASDDFSPSREEFQPNEDPRIVYLIASDDTGPFGLFTLLPQNGVCFEIHCAMMPSAWGKQSTEALKKAIAFMWALTPARRIVASIPASNRLAIALAKRAGMTQYGINERSILKGAALIDQVLLGVSSCPQ